MKVKIKENSWMARWAAINLGEPGKGMAFTFGQTIHLYRTPKETFLRDLDWLCHELKHVEQFRRYGFYSFIFRYLWESLCRGYYNNYFEAEARAAAGDRNLLEGVEFI